MHCIPPRHAHRPPAFRLVGCLILAALLIGTGCRREEPVVEYRVPKESPTSPAFSGPMVADGSSPRTAVSAAGPATMLVALVDDGPQVWYFKLLGAGDLPTERKTEFRAFLEGLTFQNGKPSWQLPAGWKEEPGAGMRFATIDVGSAGFDLSVIALPAPQELLPNVNRWRGQLSLPPATADELAELVQTVRLKEGQASLVELHGTLSAGPPAMGPFASAAAPAPTAAAGLANRPAESPASVGFTYQQPEGWRPGKSGPMRRLAFEAGDDDEKVEITVTTLGKLGSALLPNVNRWRVQVGLEPVSEESLGTCVRSVDVSGEEGSWVELLPQEAGPAILAVITIRGDTGWFFKMMGPSATIAAEREHFDEFIRSVQFPKSR